MSGGASCPMIWQRRLVLMSQGLAVGAEWQAIWATDSNRRAILTALKVRAFERQMLDEFSKGSVRGTVHTCLGQELLPSLLAELLEPADYVFGTHRAHGYYLSRTGDFEGLAAEILGKDGATSGGVGGSQHIAAGRLFTNGIQGGMVPIAVGSTLTDEPNVAIAVVGDGTLASGVLYEAMNIAKLQAARLVILVENNGIAQSTPQQQYLAGSISGRAEAIGFGFHDIDSRDLGSMRSALEAAIGEARTGKPQLVNVTSYRLGPHSKGDDNRATDAIRDLEQKDLLNQLIENVPEVAQAWLDARSELAAVAEGVSAREPASAHLVDHARDVLGEFPREAVESPHEEVSGRDLTKERLRTALAECAGAVLIGEDIETRPPGMERSYGGAFGVSLGLSEAYPGAVRNFPIAEAGIAGVAIGRALAGYPTIAEIMFGDFSTLIVDQIRQQASKLVSMYGRRLPIPVLFRLPMGGRRGYGPTHSQNLESMFIGIPNLIVFSANEWNRSPSVYKQLLDSGLPSIAIEGKDLYTRAMIAATPRGYLREAVDGGNSLSPIRVRPNTSRATVTIVAHGFAASLVLPAIEQLALKHEIFVDLFVYQVISPFDGSHIVESARATERVLVVEEAVSAQGWASAVVADLGARHLFPLTVRTVGGKGDIGASSGSEAAALLDEEEIVRAVAELARGAQ